MCLVDRDVANLRVRDVLEALRLAQVGQSDLVRNTTHDRPRVIFVVFVV